MYSGFSCALRIASLPLLTAVLGSSAGCHPSNESPYGPGKQRPFIVRVDPNENGAAGDVGDSLESSSRSQPRQLAFKVSGTAPKPSDGNGAEARIAASQAAIINAFMNALIDAREARGQSTSDFTARLGPRLTVNQKTTNGVSEARIGITYNGSNNQLMVRDGVLQHPPVDIRLIRRIFDETNGEFSLLSTDEDSNERYATATVACYLPSGFRQGVLMNVARNDTDEP